MKEEKNKNLRPSIVLDYQLLHLLAIAYAGKLPHFKGKRLTARCEVDHNERLTGNVIVEVYEVEE